MPAGSNASVETPSPSLTRARNLTLIAALLGWMFDGMEMGIFGQVARPALMSMAPEDLVGKAAESFVQHWTGLITAWFLVGAALGGFVFGWLGDRIGRVGAMTLSILFYSLFTGLCYFAQTPWQMGAGRFLAALGMGGEWSLGVALVMEIWPARLRPLMAGCIGAAANVGFVIVGLMGMAWPATPDSWRWYFLVGALPAVLTFVLRIFVPESEKWKEAAKGEKVRPIREIFSAGAAGPMMLSIVLATVPILVSWGIIQWIPLWIDQFAGKNDPGAKGLSGFLVAFGAIIGSLAAPLAGQALGRRPTYFILCLLSLVSGYWLFMGIGSYGFQFKLALVVMGGFATSFYGWLPLYLPELFPTRVRATAQGIAFNAARILAAIGVMNMGAIMGMFGGSYAKAGFAICLVYVLGMAIIWLAPETKGRPLPE